MRDSKDLEVALVEHGPCDRVYLRWQALGPDDVCVSGLSADSNRLHGHPPALDPSLRPPRKPDYLLSCCARILWFRICQRRCPPLTHWHCGRSLIARSRFYIFTTISGVTRKKKEAILITGGHRNQS